MFGKKLWNFLWNMFVCIPSCQKTTFVVKNKNVTFSYERCLEFLFIFHIFKEKSQNILSIGLLYTNLHTTYTFALATTTTKGVFVELRIKFDDFLSVLY